MNTYVDKSLQDNGNNIPVFVETNSVCLMYLKWHKNKSDIGKLSYCITRLQGGSVQQANNETLPQILEI